MTFARDYRRVARQNSFEFPAKSEGGVEEDMDSPLLPPASGFEGGKRERKPWEAADEAGEADLLPLRWIPWEVYVKVS